MYEFAEGWPTDRGRTVTDNDGLGGAAEPAARCASTNPSIRMFAGRNMSEWAVVGSLSRLASHENKMRTVPYNKATF